MEPNVVRGASQYLTAFYIRRAASKQLSPQSSGPVTFFSVLDVIRRGRETDPIEQVLCMHLHISSSIVSSSLNMDLRDTGQSLFGVSRVTGSLRRIYPLLQYLEHSVLVSPASTGLSIHVVAFLMPCLVILLVQYGYLAS